jgi:hypothetical protein
MFFFDSVLDVEDCLECEALGALLCTCRLRIIAYCAKFMTCGINDNEATMKLRFAVESEDGCTPLYLSAGVSGYPEALRVVHHNKLWTEIKI